MTCELCGQSTIIYFALLRAPWSDDENGLSVNSGDKSCFGSHEYAPRVDQTNKARSRKLFGS